MKDFLKLAGIFLAVYFGFKVWDLLRKGKQVAEAVTDAGKMTAKSPVNIFATGYASWAFLYDLARGRPLEESKQIWKDTVGGIWTP